MGASWIERVKHCYLWMVSDWNMRDILVTHPQYSNGARQMRMARPGMNLSC